MTFPAPETAAHPDGSHASFGPFQLYSDGRLFRDSSEIRLPPKELAILRVLISHAGEIVAPEQLRRSGWGSVHVSDDSLPRCVSSLRAHLDSQECIQTVYKRGYRFLLSVRSIIPNQLMDGSGAPRDRERRSIHAAGPPRLAILPFSNGEGVPECFGIGIAEETMLRLARTRSLGAELIARDSVFHLAGLGATAREIGEALRANLAVAGTITALPMHLRLRIEMIRVSDAVQLWVEDFLVPRDHLAYADARAAKRIAARIRGSIATAAEVAEGATSPGGFQAGVMDSRRNHRNEAYASYLEACREWNSPKIDRHQSQNAMRGFQRALELDPSLLDARIRLAHGYLSDSSHGFMRPDMAAEQARKQAEIALLTGAPGPLLYPALGWIHLHHDRDYAAAAEAFDRVQRSGYDPQSTIYRLRFALSQGRCNEAIDLLDTGLETDPYSPVLNGRLAWALHLAGDTDAAVEQARRMERLFPGHTETLFFCAIVYAAASRAGDAAGELPTRAMGLATRLIQSAPTLDAGFATLAYVQARQGCIIEARAQLDQLQWLARERFVLSSFLAPALVELGELDAALVALSTAERQHCPWLFELLMDPRLEPLRNEPEFQSLRRLTREMVSANASVA